MQADSAKGHEGVRVAVIGAVIFGLLGAAAVYGADSGADASAIPIVVGVTLAGGGVGYLIGSLIPKVE